MAEAAIVKVTYQANTAEYTKKVEEAKKKTKEFGKQVGDTKKSISDRQFNKALGQDSIGDMLETLKLGEKTLKAVAMVGGATLFAGAFENVMGSLDKFTTMLRTSDAGLEQLTGDLVRSLPILGSAVQGFDSFWDIFTGKKAELEQIKKATANIDAQTAAITSLLNAKKSLAEYATGASDDASFKASRAKLEEGSLEQKLFDLEHERTKAKEENAKKAEAIAEKETAASAKALAAMKEELNAKKLGSEGGRTRLESLEFYSSGGTNDLSRAKRVAQETAAIKDLEQKVKLSEALINQAKEEAKKKAAEVDSVIDAEYAEKKKAAELKDSEETQKKLAETNKKLQEEELENKKKMIEQAAKFEEGRIDRIAKLRDFRQKNAEALWGKFGDASKTAREVRDVQYSSAESRRTSFTVLNNNPKQDEQLKAQKEANGFLGKIAAQTAQPLFNVMSAFG